MAYHSITFINGSVSEDENGETVIRGSKRNTWDDWHIVPTSRPTLKLPDVNTNYVDVPGTSGSLDLSEALTGYPTYKDREGSFEFFIMNQYLTTSAGDNLGYNPGTEGAWSETLENISLFLHGQKLKMVLEDYPGKVYSGRFSIDDVKSEDIYTSLTIKYHLDALSTRVKYSKSLWLWDPLKFTAGTNKYTGVEEGDKGTHITAYDNNEYSSATTISIVNDSSFPANVTINVTIDSVLVTQNGTVNLSEGSNSNGLLVAYPGTNTWTISAKDTTQTGKYSIYFQSRGF